MTANTTVGKSSNLATISGCLNSHERENTVDLLHNFTQPLKTAAAAAFCMFFGLAYVTAKKKK